MKKPTKLVQAVELLYVFVKCSCFFWWSLLKDFVVYGWFVALNKTMYCVDHPESSQERLKKISEKLPKSLLWQKVVSVGVFLSLVVIFVAGKLANPQLTLLFLIVGVGLLAGLFLFTTNFVLTENPGLTQVEFSYLILKKAMIPSFLNAFILASYLLWALSFLVSPVLFFLVAPGGIFWLLKKGQQKTVATKGSNHDFYQFFRK